MWELRLFRRNRVSELTGCRLCIRTQEAAGFSWVLMTDNKYKL